MSQHGSKPAELLPGLPFAQCDQQLQRYFSRRLGNRQDVRELTQEVWLRLCRVADRQRLKEPMAYVYRTAANVLAEFFLRQRREATTPDPEKLELGMHADGALQDEVAERAQAQHDLLNALRTMPAAYQHIVRMRLCEQKSFRDIAETTGFTEATARRYYFRAVALLWKSEWQ